MRSCDPTPVVRAVTYERDHERCVSCGSDWDLEYQHRASVGQGGSQVRPRYPDGVTTCHDCNPRYEGDRQIEALLMGWKVRHWVFAQGRTDEVPVFYRVEQAWFRLTLSGARERVAVPVAARMMREVYGAEYDGWLEKAA